MRWLIIALLVSLGALLLAAAGVARHILLQRRELRRKQARRARLLKSRGLAPVDETDLELEP